MNIITPLLIPTNYGDVSQCALSTLPQRFVLGVNTGHTGSDTLSTEACYHDDGSSNLVAWNFEGGHVTADSTQLSTYGLKGWYASLTNMSDAERDAKALEMVERRYLPDMVVSAAQSVGSAAVASATYVDIGHHVNLGYLEPVVSWFAQRSLLSKLTYVRLRRHRYATVRSWMSMSPSMTACGDYGSIDHLAPSAGLYHLCAAVHHAVLPVPAGVWERLDTVQRNLWFIDEIEARWQRVVTQYPSMGRHVIEWCSYDDYDAQLPDYAHLIGGPGLAPQACKDTTSHHQNWTDAVYNDSYVASRDEEYALLMGLKEVVDGSTVWTVKGQSVLATQQAVLCP